MKGEQTLAGHQETERSRPDAGHKWVAYKPLQGTNKIAILRVYILEATQSKQHKAAHNHHKSTWMVTDSLHSYAALSWLQNVYLVRE